MRSLTRLVLFILLAAGLYWLYPKLHLSGLIRQGNDAYKLELVRQATPAIAYSVQPARWLDFHLDAGTSQIRIITNATVRDLDKTRQARRMDPARRWKYALQIEVLDRGNRVLMRQERHLRTDLSLYQDTQGREYTPAFYLQNDRTPLNGAVIRLNFAGVTAPEKLRLRLLDKDEDITDVVARIYIPKKITERKARYLWQRMSEKAKSSLATGNVYPTELLTEDEKRALILNTWQPVGPEGHADDYQRWNLYVLQENEGEMVDEAVPPAGLPVSERLSGILPLPEAGGKFRLHFEPLPGHENLPGTIRLKWYGATAFLRKEIRLDWAGRAQDHALNLGGGMLEIVSDRAMSCRIYQLDSSTTEREITPPPQYLRTYIASPGRALDYVISHIGQTATPIKLDVRYLTAPQADLRTERNFPKLRYSLLDHKGAMVKEGMLEITQPDTHYDQIVNDYSSTRLSEPATSYFLLPPNIERLRLTAVEDDAPLLVSVHSRPLDLPHSYRAPEDQFDFDAQGKRISAWFPLKPEHSVQLLSENATMLLNVQPRPPEDKPALLTGHYFWEDFHPLGDWKGRYLLTPQEPGVPFRDDALPSAYQEIPHDREWQVFIPIYENLRTLAPSLVWVRPQTEPATFRLYVDGKLHQEGRIAGRNGELNLIPLAVGTHQIRLESDAGGKMFMNHLKPAGQIYLKRLANIIDGKLQFDILRTTLAEETLSASLFQPRGSVSRTRLRVDIRGPRPAGLQPSPAWIFPVRHFDVRPEHSTALTVFSTQSGLTDTGQSFYIPLPEGAPTGHYRITLRVMEGPGGNVLLSRLTPGIQPTRRVLHESDVISYETVQD